MTLLLPEGCSAGCGGSASGVGCSRKVKLTLLLLSLLALGRPSSTAGQYSQSAGRTPLAEPPPTTWALLHVDGLDKAAGQCLDAVGGGPVIDTYGCVDPRADNALNELFNLTADGRLAVQSDPSACVIASPCSGQTSGLCLSNACGSVSARWLERGVAGGSVSLSPASQPAACLTFDNNLTSKLHLQSCVNGDSSQEFTWGPAVLPAPPPAPVDLPIQLDGFDSLLPYEGIGALSAGADAALLFDYEPVIRNRILDMLFLPHFPGGANLQILKVEIPGDVQSTCGSESSHEHYEGDSSFARGYEWKLMSEARKRNPDIRIYALEWSVPSWVGGNGSIKDAASDYSTANRKYTIDWLRGAKDFWNISVDFLGFWNEPAQIAPVDYIVAMRGDLDAFGFNYTKLVALDTGMGSAKLYVDAMLNNTGLQQAVHAFGFHGGASEVGASSWLSSYTRLDPATRPRLWASEDGNLPCSMSGANQWGRTHLQNWLTLNYTATVRWSLIWSAYPGTICNGAGMLRADQPWSGRFQTAAPNLAASAHITWFTKPGMYQLPLGSGSSVMGDVSAVTWVDGLTTHFTTVLESLSAKSPEPVVVRLHPAMTHQTDDIAGTLRLYASHLDPVVLAKAGLDCEDCRKGPLMARQPDLVAADDGTFSLTVHPGFMYTVTSLPPPAVQSLPELPKPLTPAFPLPLETDFQRDTVDSIPRFFNNYEGSFSIAKADGKDNYTALKQWVFRPPLVWHFIDNEPLAIVAPGYSNYEVSSDVRIDQANASDPRASYVSVCGRMTKLYASFGPTPTGYCLELRASTPSLPPAPTPSQNRVRVTKCAGGAKTQRWQLAPDMSIRSEAGGCLTLAVAHDEPSKCGDSPLPPCVNIPNASPLTVAQCGKPLLNTQKWSTGLASPVAQDATGSRAPVSSGKWIQFDAGDSRSRSCVEVNMASVHAGDRSPVVDTWECLHNNFDNLLWTHNVTTSQLMSSTVSLPGMCLDAPAEISPLPPPAPPMHRATPMWRLVAHASYRFDGSNHSTSDTVLGSGQFPTEFDLTAWHSVKLRLNGSNIRGVIDGTTMINTDSHDSFDHGLVGLGSGWNVAWYQNVSIVPLGTDPPAGAAMTLVDTNTGITRLNGSDGANWFGLKIRISMPGVLTAVARFRSAGSIGRHNVSLFKLDSEGKTTAVTASALVSMTGSMLDSFGFMWARLRSPVPLPPGDYIVASEEHPMGDPFYVQGADGPCASNSDGHDGGSPWLLPLLEDSVALLGAARSIGFSGQYGSNATSLAEDWEISTVSDQSQHGYGPVNFAFEARPLDGFDSSTP